jgi:CBS-domain-containing membrane protein
MVRIVDPKFRGNAGRYLFQCALAFLTVLGVLFFLDLLLHTVIIASLGATAFIVFTMPNSRTARTRALLGGHLVGVGVGCAFSLLSRAPLVLSLFHEYKTPLTVFGALAVAAAIFLMVCTNTEHPPAAGMALGLVSESWDARTVAFIFIAVALLALARRLLRRVMIDLV